MSNNVKTGDFISPKVQWWSFIDNVVYCNYLHSIKAAFLELEKAMFTSAILVPMVTIITPGPYIQSKQSKAIHAKCILKVNCEKKMGLITKSDCISVTDLNQTFRYIGNVVDVCPQLLKDFHDYCLFSMSDQLVVGIAFSCFWLKNYKNKVLRYSLTNKQYFYVEESLN